MAPAYQVEIASVVSNAVQFNFNATHVLTYNMSDTSYLRLFEYLYGRGAFYFRT